MKDIKSKLLAALAAIQQACEDRRAGAVNSGEWGTADQALLVMFPSADSFTYDARSELTRAALGTVTSTSAIARRRGK